MNSKQILAKKMISLAITSLVLCGSACTEQEPVKPNLLFILIDDLGWKDVGFNGSTFYETPNLDQLADEGTVFTNAYAACPVCSPTRASIMTGKYPTRIGITDYIPGENRSEKLKAVLNKYQMELEEKTIAEALKEGGYRTGFIGKWHLTNKYDTAEVYYPQKQGFDVNIAGSYFGHPYNGYFSPYNIPYLENGPDGEYLTEKLTNEAIKFIQDQKDKDDPFLLYLAYYTVHTPIQAKEDLQIKYEEKKRSLIDTHKPSIIQEHDARTLVYQYNAKYAGMVENMDTGIGNILAKLNELGMKDNTIVIFYSDNGGWSTDGKHPGGATSNYPLRAGKGWCYEGGIRVPLIIKWPGVTKQGSRIDEPVISMDMYPTMLEMAGLPSNTGQHIDGLSLVPLIKGDKTLSRDAIYWHYPHYHGTGHRPSGAVRLGEWKLLEFFEDMNVELYNLKDDPGESVDLSTEEPDKVEKLKKMLHQWREETGALMPEPIEEK